MECPNCQNENLTDHVVCPTCATTVHAARNCRCLECLPEAFLEKFPGAVLIATSGDAPGSVRVPFTFDAIKPECRQGIAESLAGLVKDLAKAA